MVAATLTLTDDDIATLRHARTFLVSREKMHPVGVAQWDEMITRIETQVWAYKTALQRREDEERRL